MRKSALIQSLMAAMGLMGFSQTTRPDRRHEEMQLPPRRDRVSLPVATGKQWWRRPLWTMPAPRPDWLRREVIEAASDKRARKWQKRLTDSARGGIQMVSP